MSGILPRIVYPDTVRDAASDLLTAVKGTDDTVKGCTKLDKDVATAWQAWSDDKQTWLQAKIDNPGWLGLGSLMDQIETVTQELLRWQKTLNGFCDNVVSPVIDPNQIPAPQDWWKGVLEWTVVGVAIVGGAYVVGQVVSLLPKPSLREPEHRALAE